MKTPGNPRRGILQEETEETERDWRSFWTRWRGLREKGESRKLKAEINDAVAAFGFSAAGEMKNLIMGAAAAPNLPCGGTGYLARATR
jgi:hypothetical protein